MKHALRESLMTIIAVLGVSTLYRARLRRRGPLVRVLCFHDVPDHSWFDETLDFLIDRYHVISPDDFKQQNFHPSKINILLTFDDGYASWIDVALPALTQRGLAGWFFLNSGLLDTVGEEARDEYVRNRLLLTPKAVLTWSGATALVTAGQSIGGHTVTHPNAALLTVPEASHEIQADKKRLTEMLSVVPDAFAYPFGQRRYYTSVTVKVASEHYQRAFVAHPGFVTKDTPPHQINRTCVLRNQSLRSLRYFIEGEYDMLRNIMFK